VSNLDKKYHLTIAQAFMTVCTTNSSFFVWYFTNVNCYCVLLLSLLLLLLLVAMLLM